MVFTTKKGKFLRQRPDSIPKKALEKAYPGPNFKNEPEYIMNVAAKLNMTFRQVYKVFWDLDNTMRRSGKYPIF